MALPMFNHVNWQQQGAHSLVIALLQGCMFRQSVRQAMKGITVELEGMQGNLVTAADTQRVAAQIGSVIQLIAEVVHKTHEVSNFLAGI